jgi:hypothetical protein
MQFLHPGFLLGLGAIALPVIIHLVARVRARVVLFPSLRFLRQVDRQVTRWRRIQELLLLALRVLALALLALALAGPVYKPSGGAAGSPGTAAAIVLDDSYSMGLRDAEGTLFARSRALARTLLASLRPGDAACVLTAAREPKMTRDPAALAAALDGLDAGAGDGALRPLAEAALKLLRDTGAAQRELYLLSDFQRRAADFAGVDWRVPNLSIVLVPLASPRRDNLTLESLDPLSPFATTSAPYRVRVAVVNRGPDPTGKSLKIRVDDAVAAEPMVFVPGGGTSALTADLTFDKPGWRTIVAELDADALPADDRRRLCVEVRPALRVLFVRPEAAGPLARSFYLDRALNPGGPADTGVHASSVDPGRLAETDLAPFPVVFLVECVPPDAEAARRLRSYVAAGGSLVIAADPAAEPEAFNAALAVEADGIAPLSPARLAGSLGHARDPQSYQAYRDVDLAHPVFARLRRSGTPIDWGTAAFFHVARVELIESLKPRVLARFTAGSPAIVEHRCGAGRVVLFASALHGDATTLPRKVGFVPLVHSLVAYLAAPPRQDGFRVGDRMRLQLPAAGAPPSARLVLSPREMKEARASVAAGLATYDFGPAAAPGAAAFEWFSEDRSESRRVAVNVNPEEGSLDYADPAALVPGAHVLKKADDLPALLARIRFGRNLTIPCLVAALLAALAEALLANRFAFGSGKREGQPELE